MSHGDRVDAPCRRGFIVTASDGSIPFAAMADERGGFTACSSIRRCTHTTQGRVSSSASYARSPAATRSGAQATSSTTRSSGSAPRSAAARCCWASRAALIPPWLPPCSTARSAINSSCVFVDHGLLRLDEGDQVMATFAEHLGVRVIRVDAEARFLAALAGVADPEAKRKIIGRTFVEVFDEEARKLSGVSFLAQGTIYPDVIESAGARTGKAHVIKSHHNVGGLPEKMHLKLVEPLRELFKDEVRRLGVELGLPREMVYRHPFPGPGLGVRILGEVRKEFADLLRRADAIFIDELRRARTLRSDQPGVRRVPAGQLSRRHGRRPSLRPCDRPARGRDHRFHDRALGAPALRFPRRTSPAGSSTRSPASPASSTTSPASRPRRSSGNDCLDDSDRAARRTGSTLAR